MPLWELKPGNGGHGLEPYNTVDGKYGKVDFEIEGNKIDGWETLRDLLLDVSQQQEYSAMSDSQKEQVDNYIKENYYALLQQEIDRLNEEYDISQVKNRLFNSVGEMADNIGNLFDDNAIRFIQKHRTTNNWNNTVDFSCRYKNRWICFMAVALQNSKYGDNVCMEVMDKQNFDDIISKINFANTYEYADQDIVNNYVKSNDLVPVFRGFYDLSSSDVNLIKKHYLEGIKSDENDTLLGSCGGMYGSAIYMTTSEGYFEDYDNSSFAIRGLVDTKKSNIYYIESESDNDGSDTPLAKEISRKSSIIANKFKQSLISKGYSSSDAQELSDYLKRKITIDDRFDFGFCCMLMGYDAFTANGHQLSILNPSVVKVRGE